jgi:hypothetical protein
MEKTHYELWNMLKGMLYLLNYFQTYLDVKTNILKSPNTNTTHNFNIIF